MSWIRFTSPNGALVAYCVSVVMCRWGGGADHGKTHVFSIHEFCGNVLSEQCVTDDFGNLVAVA